MQIQSPICCLEKQEEKGESFSGTIVYLMDHCDGVSVDHHVRDQGRVLPEEPPQGCLKHLVQTLCDLVCQSVLFLHTLIFLLHVL